MSLYEFNVWSIGELARCRAALAELPDLWARVKALENALRQLDGDGR